jgi:superfamily II DNA or RNA helicase
MEKEVSIKLIIQGNYITIDGEMNPLLVKGINTKFSYELKNAHFIRKNNPGFDGMVHFYNQRKQTLPIGFLKGLTKTITDYSEYKKLKLNLQIEDKRVFNEEKIEYKELKTQLRNYQIEAVDAYLKEKISMLEIATGGGKSLVMAEIIKRLGYKTLIVVTRLELLNQLKAVLEKELETEVGVIGGSIYNPKHITIGTIQTLVKDLRKHREYLASVRFSIIDECHHINRNSFWRLSQCLINTENRLGTSGTIKRTDGDDMYLTAVNGNIVYNLNAEKLIGMGFLVKPQIIFIKDYLSKEQIEVLKNRSNLGLVNEKEKYNLFYESFIMNNEIRNDIVKRIVEKNKDKQILIITKRIEHANHLAEITGGNLLYGSTEKDIRKDLLGDFKNGKIKLLIGTIGIFQEGLDLVNLDILINTTGNKSDIASIQVLGRLLRKMEGKTTCVYYDFIDESRFMRSASRSRIKAFKDENHNIDIIGVDAI